MQTRRADNRRAGPSGHRSARRAGPGGRDVLARPCQRFDTLCSMSLIECPNCATDEQLSGERQGAVIVVACGRCGITWERPAAPHCDRCGSTDVVAYPVPLIERSRGTQQSITAMHIETMCRVCDAQRLSDRGEGHLPARLG